ncbi:hypothetical protein D8674_007268 [Pyrus ussuriensis x Pyrus communis]|uniref:Uncharacterized protein n=1 Tax=Pyrus ussuriensis x Pyrus communis TaxID=2448454 RepID=A0A5N5G1A2_9ROSA|nr:hypothetical protein D8674_007268 [Pyrus ussuriensis x Pyrus communis]
MRFASCKIHCPPLICFCKPNSPHIYTPGPLELQNSPTPPPPPPLPNSKLASVPETSDHLADEEIIKGEKLLGNANPQPSTAQPSLKSSLRKPNSDSSAPKQEELKKTVQWIDILGKQLVDIREFQCRYSISRYQITTQDRRRTNDPFIN